MTEHSAETASRPQRKGSVRQTLKIAVIAVVAIAILLWFGFWLYHRLTHVSGKDAQVTTHEITVSSRLAGRVTGFELIKGDTLAQAEPVAQLYSRPDELRLEQMQARVARMQTQIDGQTTRIALANRQIAGGEKQMRDVLKADEAAEQAAQANMKKAQQDAERSAALYKQHGVSEAERDADRYAYRSARAEHDRAQRQLRIDRIALENARTGLLTNPSATVDNPEVLENKRAVLKQKLAEAQAELEHQRTRLDDLAVTAPLAGVVDQTFIEQSEYVSAGQPILMMHDPDDVWIEANMKETKIADLAVGQPVDIHVDARPDTAYRGHVQVIGQAATNQFALLPNPNPSGNFTKITQRIPVRIAIDDGPPAALSPGMMVEVDIDITAEPKSSTSTAKPGEADDNTVARTPPGRGH